MFPREKANSVNTYYVQWHQRGGSGGTRSRAGTQRPTHQHLTPPQAAVPTTHAATSSSPPFSATVPPAPSPLTPELQQLVSITQLTGWKPIDTIEVLKTFGQLGRVGEREPPRYHRPHILNERQNEIIDAIQDPQVKLVLIEGDRRTGKSTSAWVAINELMFAGWREWGLWGAKRDSASKILRDLAADRITYQEINPIIANITAMRLQRVDGCTLNAHATTMADSKGFDYDGVWIEEFDQMLRDNPAVFAAIIPILRAKPSLKIIMTANRDTGAYKMLREYLAENEDPAVQQAVRFYTLTRDDAPHLSDSGNDPLIEPLMKLTVGEEKTAEQLHNQESYQGEIFRADDLVNAYNTYDEWMLDMGLVDASLHRTRLRPLHTVISVDPGFADATAITVESQYREHIYEEESHEFHGRNDAGREVSQEHIIQFIRALAVKYGADILIESNSGGLWWGKSLREMGLRVIHHNFTAPGTDTDRESHIRLLNGLLESNRYHYKNDRFRAQAVMYSIAEKAKSTARDHGDLVDAKLHAVRYLLQKQTQTRRIVRSA